MLAAVLMIAAPALSLTVKPTELAQCAAMSNPAQQLSCIAASASNGQTRETCIYAAADEPIQCAEATIAVGHTVDPICPPQTAESACYFFLGHGSGGGILTGGEVTATVFDLAVVCTYPMSAGYDSCQTPSHDGVFYGPRGNTACAFTKTTSVGFAMAEAIAYAACY